MIGIKIDEYWEEKAGENMKEHVFEGVWDVGIMAGGR